MAETLLQRHESAFIETFVEKRWRERYRIKGGLPREDLSHKLAERLDDRFCLRLNDYPPRQVIAKYLTQLKPRRAGVFISQLEYLDGVEFPARAMLADNSKPRWIDGSAYGDEDTIVSLVPGQIALYHSETPGPRFICVADSKLRAQIARDLGISA